MVYKKSMIVAAGVLVTLFSLPSHATSSQYLCSGNHRTAGSASDADSGYWDGVFTASSAQEAAAQAKRKIQSQNPGDTVAVFDCRRI
ncbi:hypothetical protein [Serratia ureilytica]|uniref:hypothetical protein n=1 Tax=Serratia TaxID=613 RepID=UPI001F06CE19|nr:hypothetical protein [Serratia ureilytica]ELI8814464.1 hypothetical protein [Serratia marcescens]ELI8844719.1 hypothetical protein [Serratia marcescens]UMK53597.1 hypothetical protein L2D49_04430 [Serratia ureilytica]